MLDSEPASSPSHSSLHFIIDHQNPILVQQLSQPLEVFLWRNNIPTLSLDRFDEEGRNILRWKILVQNLLLDKIDTVHITLRIGHVERAPVAVREWDVRIPWNHREEMSPLNRLARGKTQRSQRPSVKRSREAEKTVFARVPLCKFHRGLDSLGAAVAQEHFLLKAPRSYLDKFLG